MFNRLFGRKSSTQKQVDEIFGKLSSFLADEARQNATLSDEVRAVLETGPAVDKILGAVGEFGRDPRNPIPVNGPIGEVLYLSSLVSERGDFLFAHRLGSQNKIDVFETVTADGENWDLLYLSLYHPRRSRIAPLCYSFRSAEAPPFIYATNTFTPDFPHQMRQAVSEWMTSVLNLPMVPPEIRQAIESGRFSRPAAHSARLQILRLDGNTQKAPNKHLPLLLGHVETQSTTVAAVLERNLGCERADQTEALFFCAATLSYAYNHYGREKPDRRLLEEFAAALAADCAKRSLTFGEALTRYQTRYAEYAALYDALFEEGKDDEHKKHWLVTIMMHLVERATGKSAHGHMVKISVNAPVIAAIFDDAFKLVRTEVTPA